MRKFNRAVVAGVLSVPMVLTAGGIASAGGSSFDQHQSQAGSNGASVEQVSSHAKGNGDASFEQNHSSAGPGGASSQHTGSSVGGQHHSGGILGVLGL